MTEAKVDYEFVVPQSMYDDMLAWNAMPNPYRRLLKPPTWEERLATAIEQRSIRYRLRAFRRDWAGRLSLAYDALRDRHYCADDD